MFEILLFLYANNFLTYANYLAIILVIYCMWKSKFIFQVSFSVTTCFLVLSSLTYIVFYMKNFEFPGFSSLFLRFIAPIALFYVGTYRGKKGIKRFMDDMLIIGFAEFVHGFFNVITNRKVKVLEIEGRQYQDIYGGAISATLQNLLFIVMCSLLFYMIACEKRKKTKIFGIVAVVCGLYGTIANASRSLIYLTAICFMAALSLYSFLYHHKSKAFNVWVSLFVVFSIVGIAMWLNLFHVTEWFANTALGQRLAQNTGGNINHNLRLQYTRDILKLLPKYPMGDIPYSHYAHNLWVDVAKEAGTIPFVLYILFAFSSLIIVSRTLKLKNIGNESKVFIACLTVAYFIVFFSEPVIIGSPQIFSAFCFMMGCLTSIVKNGHHRSSSILKANIGVLEV